MFAYLATGANKIMAIGHNAKAFDLHFILYSAIMLKWKPDFIMEGLKVISMKMEHLIFLDSVSILPLYCVKCLRPSV